MRGTLTFIALMGVFSLSMAEAVTFTLGKPEDYKVTGTSIAVPPGDTLEIHGNGEADYGVDVALSDEIQKRIQKTIKNNCKDKLNSECFVKIREVIETPETELQTRFAPLIPLAALGALMAGGVGWYLEKSEEKYKPFHVAPHVISTASAMATASEIVVIPTGNASPITITASPVPTATGTETATVTTFGASVEDHKKGDVGIIIPESIAKMLDSYLGKDQTGDCPDGQSFNEKEKDKRELSGLQSSVCGAELTMANTAMAGTLLHIMGTQVPPRIKGDAVRAMNRAVTFVRGHASTLRMTVEQATKVVNFIYPLVWQKMVNNKPLKAINVIPKDAIDTEDSDDKCDKEKKKTATNCKVGCEAFGRLLECSTECSKATACTSTTGTISTTSLKPWTAIPFPKPTTTDKPVSDKVKCSRDTSKEWVASDTFVRARDIFCKDTSKKYDVDYFELWLEDSGEKCPEDECVQTINKFWDECGESHEEEYNVDEDFSLSKKRGPLKGSGEAEGKCGKYKFKKTDWPNDFKAPGEHAKNNDGNEFGPRCFNRIDGYNIDGDLKVSKADVKELIGRLCQGGRLMPPNPGDRLWEKKDMGGFTLGAYTSTFDREKIPELDYEDNDACKNFDSKRLIGEDCDQGIWAAYMRCNHKAGGDVFRSGQFTYNCMQWGLSSLDSKNNFLGYNS